MCPHPCAVLRDPRVPPRSWEMCQDKLNPRQGSSISPYSVWCPGGLQMVQVPEQSVLTKLEAQNILFSVTFLLFARAVASSSFTHHQTKHSPKPWGRRASVCGDQSILTGGICSHKSHNHPRLYPLQNYWLLKVVRNVQWTCQLLHPVVAACALQSLVAE